MYFFICYIDGCGGGVGECFFGSVIWEFIIFGLSYWYYWFVWVVRVFSGWIFGSCFGIGWFYIKVWVVFIKFVSLVDYLFYD